MAIALTTLNEPIYEDYTLTECTKQIVKFIFLIIHYIIHKYNKSYSSWLLKVHDSWTLLSLWVWLKLPILTLFSQLLILPSLFNLFYYAHVNLSLALCLLHVLLNISGSFLYSLCEAARFNHQLIVEIQRFLNAQICINCAWEINWSSRSPCLRLLSLILVHFFDWSLFQLRLLILNERWFGLTVSLNYVRDSLIMRLLEIVLNDTDNLRSYRRL